MQTVTLPQLAWFEPRNLDIYFPDNGAVEVHNMAGCDRPALTSDQIALSLENMVDTPPIRELAKGKKDAVIIFDDITRVTRPSKIVPLLLEEPQTIYQVIILLPSVWTGCCFDGESELLNVEVCNTDTDCCAEATAQIQMLPLVLDQ